MADLTTSSSGYQTGSIDTATTLVNNVSPHDAAHINGPNTAIIQIETILGVGTTLKGSAADLAARLAVSLEASGGLTVATQAQVNAMTDNTRPLTSSLNKIVMATEQTASTKTEVDFTNIPAGVRCIWLHLYQISLSGANDLLFQVGDVLGFSATGYLGSGGNTSDGYVNGTTGAQIVSNSASKVFDGVLQFTRILSTGHTWSITGVLGLSSGTAIALCGYIKNLTAELDRIRATASGPNTFDTGTFGLSYMR